MRQHPSLDSPDKHNIQHQTLTGSSLAGLTIYSLIINYKLIYMKKDLIYSITCLAFAIVIGGAVYEHLNVVPTWSAGPPVSLAMFQGEYGMNPELFWMLIHPVNIVLFIITLALHWRSARRKFIAIVLASYVAILIITAIYFVPELLSIIKTDYSVTADAQLTSRAQLWEALSIIRLGILVVLSIILFLGLTRGTARGFTARTI